MRRLKLRIDGAFSRLWRHKAALADGSAVFRSDCRRAGEACSRQEPGRFSLLSERWDDARRIATLSCAEAGRGSCYTGAFRVGVRGMAGSSAQPRPCAKGATEKRLENDRLKKARRPPARRRGRVCCPVPPLFARTPSVRACRRRDRTEGGSAVIVLDEPYASELLVSWLEESQHPVLDNGFARSLASARLNLVPREEAVSAPRRRRARLYELGERARLDRGQRAQRRPRARHQPVQGQGGHARRPCAARPRPALQDVFGRRAVRARFLPARASVRAQALRGLLQHGRPRDPKSRRLGARARRHTEELLGLAEQVSGKRRRLGLVHPRGLRRGHRVRPRRSTSTRRAARICSTCCATISHRLRTRPTACT